MENWQKAAIAALLVMIVTLGAFGLGYGAAGGGEFRFFGTTESDEGSDVIVDAYERILDASVNPPPEGALTEGAIRGMVKVLRENRDPYANFYDPDHLRDLQELTKGNFSGIGVTLRLERNSLLIVGILPDSPARRAGLKKDDVIRRVEGMKVTGKNSERTIDRIKGEPGTKVSITIERGGRLIDYELKRARIELPNVSSRMTKAGNGYLRVFGFAKGAGDQAHAQLERLVKKGADGIILDLRGNPGGLFNEAINLASLFIEDDDVVIYRSSDGEEVTHGAKDDLDANEDIPLIVLVDGGSASASEIAAAALQDNERGQLVGTRTFGKAAVQDVEQLGDNSAVKLTVATYLTPDGHDITGRGIRPNVIVVDPLAQLKRAEELLESEIASVEAQG